MASYRPRACRGSILRQFIAIVGVWLGYANIVFGQVQFNRDVRPILAEVCWRCHGFDAQDRQANLRLDVREGALQVADSGKQAIVPFQPDASELIARILSTDESLRMPPPEAPQQLTSTQIETLRQWIQEGANYETHWAFMPIVRPTIPEFKEGRNPIDAFVAARFQQNGLRFASEATPETLLRRISFDLTGLPPTLERGERFQIEDYEKVVDELLASPQFGERMAADWLDAARYADTNGYFGDKPREIWLWRNWVIDAYNANMPYDQFTIEQLAGDLLPNATLQQRVATGFNRNHMSNNETGIIEEEYRVEYVIDRLDTTMTTWLGLTVACAQCHDHKYDPVTQREFYSLFAFFNTVPERGLLVGNNPPPFISVPTLQHEQELEAAIQARVAAELAFEPFKTEAQQRIKDWEPTALTALVPAPANHVILHEAFDGTATQGVQAVGTMPKFETGVLGEGAEFDATRHFETPLPQFRLDAPWTIGFWLKPNGPLSGILSKIAPEGERRGLEILWSKGRLNVHLVDRWKVSAIEVSTTGNLSAGHWQHVAVTYDGSRQARGLRVFIDGQPAPVEILADTLQGSVETSEPLRIGRRDAGLGLYGHLDELRILVEVLGAEAIAGWARGERIRGILITPADKRSSDQMQTLLDDYIDHVASSETRQSRDRLVEQREREQTTRNQIPVTLVMDEQEQPRKTFLLERGQYDKPAEEVQPGVPAALSGWSGDAPRNRLGLARWMMSDDNPLTARVAVNRLWKQCFGHGLVRSMNDFGTQGEPPTHPELLDYLATEFRDSGWDVKYLLRLIVTSRTYRQASQFEQVNDEIRDPENRLLARGPSFRLSMEMIRDQALAVSGLLVHQLGGPSVKPYQPPGLWEEVSYNGEESYVPDTGAGLWRRSLYTFIKRQAPPPALLLFDGPTREKCVITRPQTNTPLQALQLLNDDISVEAARGVAQAALLQEGNDDQRLTSLWQRILTREPTLEELQVLRGLLERQKQRADETTTVNNLLSVGASPFNEALNRRELAAWTIVAHTVLNLDEAIVRR